ncbi:MAG: hypothetical protein M1499_05415 [Firmicutes bacterium]|jgi:hypothetical protein|nr:hypothetical protein [Bacillota bacterium]
MTSFSRIFAVLFFIGFYVVGCEVLFVLVPYLWSRRQRVQSAPSRRSLRQTIARALDLDTLQSFRTEDPVAQVQEGYAQGHITLKELEDHLERILPTQFR